MSGEDLYEDLLRSYEFLLGPLPRRGEFKHALQETFEDRALVVFNLLPLTGTTTMEKLEPKGRDVGISGEGLRATIERMLDEGLAQTYIGDTGRVYQRGNFITLVETQIRKSKPSKLRTVCAEIFDVTIDGGTAVSPTRTPSYRVVPVEGTVARESRLKRIEVEIAVPDPRLVLPIDVVTAIVKKQPLVALSDCACRKAKAMVGKDCGHPIHTCLAFNRFAQALIRSGVAREIDHEEAISVLRECESQGLVHNVSNCEDRIDFICNCCSCSCGILNSMKRGQTNAGAPSRYVVAYDASLCKLCETCLDYCPMDAISFTDGTKVVALEKCIGCGLCVSACPEGAVKLVLRSNPATIYRDPDALWDQINAEAAEAFGLSPTH